MSKLTDYGIVLLTHFAQSPTGSSFTARELSDRSGVPLPTVGKLLKVLCKADLLESHRGINGGYVLHQSPNKVSIAHVMTVLEGPSGITDCSSHSSEAEPCSLVSQCPTKSHWRKINAVVQSALQGLTLADMSAPLRRKGYETDNTPSH